MKSFFHVIFSFFGGNGAKIIKTTLSSALQLVADAPIKQLSIVKGVNLASEPHISLYIQKNLC